MIVSLIILGALVLVGAVLYVHHRLTEDNNPSGETENTPSGETGRGRPSPQSVDEPESQSSAEMDEGCCGMHITCERDSLMAAVSPEVVYYDDEELDAYRGRPAEGYSDDEIEQFRDVLLTLIPTDIAGWARSLQLRGITLPECVRDELLMIVGEARASQNKR